jgi:hypothetical protein
MIPTIPKVPTKLEEPVRALARAAYVFRGVFVQAAEGKAISEILSERQAVLALAEEVLDAWYTHLNLAGEETGNGSI